MYQKGDREWEEKGKWEGKKVRRGKGKRVFILTTVFL